MKATDEDILRQFMQEQKMEIPDKGFSRRVMHKLPLHRQSHFLQFIGTLLTVVGVFVFFAYDGLQIIIELIRNLFITIVQHNGSIHIDLKVIIVLFCLVSFFAIYKLYKSADWD